MIPNLLEAIHMKQHRSSLSILVGFLSVFLASAALAAENNPNGTWKWKFETQSGQTIESGVKLKQDAAKLTGTFIGRDGTETPIQDGKFAQDQLSFTVVRERDGQKMTSHYSGKLTGDTITGKTEIDRDGQTRTRDWVAKRETSGSATGTWKWTFEIPGGQTGAVRPAQTRRRQANGRIDHERQRAAYLGRHHQGQ